MYSQRNRGAVVAVVAIFLLALAAAPASAGRWEPAPLPHQAGDGLVAQLWDWLGSLFALGEATAPPETNEAGTCSPTGGNTRGCAIDPNGGTGGY